MLVGRYKARVKVAQHEARSDDVIRAGFFYHSPGRDLEAPSGSLVLVPGTHNVSRTEYSQWQFA